MLRRLSASGAFAIGLALSAAHSGAQAQTYAAAPAGGNVAGWTSNKPQGTRLQDWYAGSPGAGGVGPMIANPDDRRDTDFIASASDQAVHGGLAFATPAGRSSQTITGLTATDHAGAVANGDYLTFPFTTAAAPTHADGTPAPIQFYINRIVASMRSNIFQGAYANDNRFGYAVYLVDGAGNPVGSNPIEVVANAQSLAGETNHIIFDEGVGSNDALALEPETSYAVRVYLFKREASANGRAGWDDFWMNMSRNTVAELSVTASSVTSTPNGSEFDYEYSFEVYNNGPDSGSALISDPLPGVSGASGATWTCAVTAGAAAACATPSGAGPINAVEEPLESGARTTYTVRWTGLAPVADASHIIAIEPAMTSPQDIVQPNNETTVTIIRSSAASAAPVPVGGFFGTVLLSVLTAAMVGLRRNRRRAA